MRKCKDMPYHIGIVLKVYPSYRQKHLVSVNAGAQRSVYNHLVACGNEIYRLSKTASYVPSDRRRIDDLRHMTGSAANIQNALPYLYTPEVDCQTVANGMKNYRTAWKNMRERHTGVPAFHKKANDLSYQTNCHYVKSSKGLKDGTVRFLNQRYILLPKLGKIRFAGSPKLVSSLLSHTDNTRIGTVTIRKDAVGEYWVSLQIASEYPFHELLPKTGKMLGIDLNLLELVYSSDGGSMANPRFHANLDQKITKAQKKLSRMGDRAKRENRSLYESRNYQKQRAKLASLHRQVARQRADYLHTVSKHLVESQDLIAAENLQVRNLLKDHHLAKAISDAGWRTLLTQLQQKANVYGKTVILVPPQYTTQTCSECGYVLKKEERLPLSVREWDCPKCGTHHLRDQNAAKNILQKALLIMAETA